MEEADTEIVEDEPPEEPQEERCKLGDLWQLGEHRLICGDSTNVAVIDRLMDGVKADMVFTDPPFGVNVKGGKDKGNMIMGDLTQTAIPFAFEIAVTKCTKDKAHFYFCGAEANIQLYQKLFDRYLHILPKHLIWVKNGFVMKQNGYHNQFEIIYHGYKQGSGGLWYGGRTEDEASDVWHINRDASSAYLHPTQKPIALMEYLIKTFSNEGEIVLDNCMGSGSTGVACVNTNRRFIGIEKEQKYFDIAKERIERW
jgi:DNA modification methylase